jgi:hemerythrin-like metal-binding protein
MSWTDAKRLQELVELLQEQVQEPATRSAILITLNRLNTYAEQVFEQEELFLSKSRSVDLHSRKTLHKHLLKQLAHHTQDFKEAPTPKVYAEFISFLQNWLQLQAHTLTGMPDGGQPN